MTANTHSDLGLISYHLSNSLINQQYFKLLNLLTANRPFNQHIIFSSCNDSIDSVSVPILHVSQSKFFYGNLLVCDIQSLLLAVECINCDKIFYYSTDVPWEKDIRPYNYWQKIFNTHNLQIITQNQRLFDIFELTWKKPTAVVKDLNYETVCRIL